LSGKSLEFLEISVNLKEVRENRKSLGIAREIILSWKIVSAILCPYRDLVASRFPVLSKNKGSTAECEGISQLLESSHPEWVILDSVHMGRGACLYKDHVDNCFEICFTF